MRSFLVAPLLAAIALDPAACLGERVDSFVHQNRTREYHLYVPPAHDGVTPLPLIIGLHGFAGTAIGFRKDTGIDLVAEREGFYVVYPFAEDGSWHLRGFVPGAVDDVDFIRALIEHLAERYPIDENRIYLTGQSQGGFLSQQVACDLWDMIAGIAVIGSAAIPDRVASRCAPQLPKTIVGFHGTDDGTVPFDGRNFDPGDILAGVPVLPVLESMAFWAALNGCDDAPVITSLPDVDPTDGTLIDRYEWPNCDGGVQVVLYRIENGGHTWPGSIRPIGNGRRSNDIVASEEMWRVFRDRPLRR